MISKEEFEKKIKERTSKFPLKRTIEHSRFGCPIYESDYIRAMIDVFYDELNRLDGRGVE